MKCIDCKLSFLCLTGEVDTFYHLNLCPTCDLLEIGTGTEITYVVHCEQRHMTPKLKKEWTTTLARMKRNHTEGHLIPQVSVPDHSLHHRIYILRECIDCVGRDTPRVKERLVPGPWITVNLDDELGRGAENRRHVLALRLNNDGRKR